MMMLRMLIAGWLLLGVSLAQVPVGEGGVVKSGEAKQEAKPADGKKVGLGLTQPKLSE